MDGSQPPLSKNTHETSWQLLSVKRIFSQPQFCTVTASTEIPQKTLCSFLDVQTFKLPWENKSALQNLYSEVGRQKHAGCLSKQMKVVWKGFRGDAHSKSQDENWQCLLHALGLKGTLLKIASHLKSAQGPCPSFLSCFLFLCSIHPHLSSHCLSLLTLWRHSISLPCVSVSLLPLSSHSPLFLSPVMNPLSSFPSS